MGCDIHFVIERRKKDAVGAPWVGVYSSDFSVGGRPQIARRNYDFFAEVAGVRGTTKNTVWPRNVPEDISPLAWSQYMRSPTDHHTPSHMTAAEFVAAYRRAEPLTDESRAPYDAYDMLGVDDLEDEWDHRVVFWFDN